MSIKIAQRLKPFSHVPGSYSLIPGSFFRVQVFPALIRFDDLSQTYPQQLGEISLKLKGPVDDFTVLTDLERGFVKVWGKAQNGFFRYQIISDESHGCVTILIEKTPSEGLEMFSSLFLQKIVYPGEFIRLFQNPNPFIPYHPPLLERLSLGNHKTQEWEFILRRLDLTEILPFWVMWGQEIPKLGDVSLMGTAFLLKECENKINAGKPETIASSFLDLFRAGFRGIFSPTLVDDWHQGIFPDASLALNESSPLILLKEGYRLIRSLFIQEKEEGIAFLPSLPPELHCGRFLFLSTEGGTIHMEWTKKTLRRVNISAKKDQEWRFLLRSGIKQFRVRKNKNEKGQNLKSQEKFTLEKNCDYLFDNFR